MDFVVFAVGRRRVDQLDAEPSVALNGKQSAHRLVVRRLLIKLQF